MLLSSYLSASNLRRSNNGGRTRLLSIAFLLFALTLSPCSAATDNDALKSPSEYLVTGLENVEPAFKDFDGTMHAGMVPFTSFDTESNAEYMFWMFEPTEQEVDNTIVIWLNGGPGCTSFNAGLLFETAPVTTGPVEAGTCCIDQNAPLQVNNHAWTKSTTMLYVEQPGGTGFSQGPPPHNEQDLSKDFHSFLQNFFTIFDHLADHRIYIFGESYAGMYAPSIAHWIHLENQKQKKHQLHINLAGIGLGNGLIDVTQQTQPMIDFAYFHGLIDSTQRKNIQLEWERCYTQGHEADYQEEPEPYHSFNVPDECGIMSAIAEAAGGSLIPGKSFNVYDVTTFDPYASLSHVKSNGLLNSTNTRFFNDPRVKAALHAPKDTLWMGCIPGSGRRRHRRNLKEQDEEFIPIPPEYYPSEPLLEQDRPISMSPYIAQLLDDAKIDVLIYNGDRDMACLAQGSEAVLDSMEWSGADDWKLAERSMWLVDGNMAGYVKSARNLTFNICFNSGHMFPTNQPSHALDLVTRFIRRQDFEDIKTPNFAYFDPNTLVGDSHQPQATTAATGTQETTNDNDDVAAENGGGRFWAQHILGVLLCFAAGVAAGFGLATRRTRHRHEYTTISDVTDDRKIEMP